jgi:hypothetical protein
LLELVDPVVVVFYIAGQIGGKLHHIGGAVEQMGFLPTLPDAMQAFSQAQADSQDPQQEQQ